MSEPGSSSFLREMFVVGPHAGAHRVAARAGLSVFVPLCLLVVTGHHAWTAYAAFGAFTSLYGRSSRHAERAGMQLSAATCLVASVVLGCATALLPDQRWWVVVIGAFFTGLVALVSDAFGWHPPGPLFPLFGFAVCAMMPASTSSVVIGLLVASASALFSLVIGSAGALRSRGGLALPRMRRPLGPREVVQREGAVLHLVRYVVSTGIAGTLGTVIGGSHPYWAMVAAVAALSGPTLRAKLTRGVHRLIGTSLGIGLSALLLGLYPRGLWAVAIIVVMQVMAELLVGRNYALAVVFITPLALTMGQLGHEVPVGPLVEDRFVETVLGCVVSIVVLFVLRDRPRSNRRVAV